jgi:hypothetical protein
LRRFAGARSVGKNIRNLPMKNTIRMLMKMAVLATVFGAVACTSSTSDDRESSRAKTQNASTTTTAEPDIEEEGDADKVTCSVNTDCDSDERCERGRCVGLDGDQD